MCIRDRIFTEEAVLLSLRDTLKTVTGTEYETDGLTFSLGIPGRDTLKELKLPDVEASMALWEENMGAYRHTCLLYTSPVTRKLYDTLTGIQMGRIEAPEGWICKMV